MVGWQQQQQKSNLVQNQDALALLVNRQRAWVEIDLTALAHNVHALKTWLSPQTQLMAVVKADAYGHGAVKVAQTALAHGADSLAIATLAEGVELRQAGITAPMLILGAINALEDMKAVAAWDLEPTICNSTQAEAFDTTLATVGKSLAVHLKLDTGMSRLGTNWQDAVAFAQLVTSMPNLKLKSVYSHFSTADESDRTFMDVQHQRFNNALAQLKDQGIVPPQIHLANSAATLGDRGTHYDLVRVGLALYGLYPATQLAQTVSLQPVLQVKAKITQVKTISPGEGVSYGRRFIAPQETKIAVVGIGYADGVPRNLSNQLQAIVKGQLVTQIGSITMDQLMLNVNNVPHVKPGEVVTLIGQQNNLKITADDWAQKLDTISWEILCGFKHRLPRIFN
ncbi:MAG: alanine racemase [Cyanobacteria bacterium P01_A01_bin.40]